MWRCGQVSRIEYMFTKYNFKWNMLQSKKILSFLNCQKFWKQPFNNTYRKKPVAVAERIACLLMVLEVSHSNPGIQPLLHECRQCNRLYSRLFKRLAGKVNARNPLRADEKTCKQGIHSGFETQGRLLHNSKTGILVAHKKTCVLQIFLKKIYVGVKDWSI